MRVRLDAELGFEFGEFGAEGGDFGFDSFFPVGIDWGRRRGDDSGDRRDGGHSSVRVNGATKEVGVGGDATPVTRRQADDEGAFGVILHRFKFGFDALEIREGVHALGALTEFSGGLMSAKEEDAEKGDGGGGKIVDFGVQVVFELGNASACLAELEGPLGFTQSFEGAGDGGFVEAGDRLPIGGLIAGGNEGIESERIRVRNEDFFFEEAAEDAGLFEGEGWHVSENKVRAEAPYWQVRVGGGDSWQRDRF